MINDFISALEQVRDADLVVSKTARGEVLHISQLRAIRPMLEDALASLLEEVLKGTDFIVARTSNGVEIEIPNASIADSITNDTGSGAFTFSYGATTCPLSHDIMISKEDYMFELEMKGKTAEQKAEERARIEASRKERKALLDRIRKHAEQVATE